MTDITKEIDKTNNSASRKELDSVIEELKRICEKTYLGKTQLQSKEHVLNTDKIEKEAEIQKESIERRTLRLPDALEHMLQEKKRTLMLAENSNSTFADISYFNSINNVLLSKDLNFRDSSGKTILDYAINKKDFDLVELLLLYGAYPSDDIIYKAVVMGEWDLIKKFIGYRETPPFVNKKFFLIFLGAIENEQLNKSRYFAHKYALFMEMRSDFEKAILERQYQKALPLSLCEEKKNVISSDLEESLKIVQKYCTDKTISESIQYALGFQNVNYQNIFGETLLMLFAIIDFEITYDCPVTSLEIMRKLLENNANPTLKNVDGEDALQYANSPEKVELLGEFGVEYDESDMKRTMQEHQELLLTFEKK